MKTNWTDLARTWGTIVVLAVLVSLAAGIVAPYFS